MPSKMQDGITYVFTKLQLRNQFENGKVISFHTL